MTAPPSASDHAPALGHVTEPDWSTATAGNVTDWTGRLVSAAFLAATAERQALRNLALLSMSSLGGCTKYAAFKVAGWPPSNEGEPEEARQALLGTWLHEVLLPLLAKLLGPGAVYEEPVELHAGGLVIPGSLDLAYGPVLWDLKTVKEWSLAGVRRLDGPYVAHWLQVMGYAYARWQAGYDVRWVVWIYFDRSTGEVHVETEAFVPPEPGKPLPAPIAAVIRRAEVIRFWSADPQRAPRQLAVVEGRTEEPYVLRGPGPKGSVQCDRCEFLTDCWGPTAVAGQHGAQRILTATPEGIATALALYAAGATKTSAGTADKEFAKLQLADVPDGEYGDWVFKHGRPGEDLDEAAVRADYAARGVKLPMKRTAGRTIVKPAARVEGEV